MKFCALAHIFYISCPSLIPGVYCFRRGRRLQFYPYFCEFKYTRAVKQKVWNEAENREREARALRARETLTSRFSDFFTDFEKTTDCFAVYRGRNFRVGVSKTRGRVRVRVRVRVFKKRKTPAQAPTPTPRFPDTRHPVGARNLRSQRLFTIRELDYHLQRFMHVQCLHIHKTTAIYYRDSCTNC